MKQYLRQFLINRWAAFVHDMAWIPVAIYGALWLRFNLHDVPTEFFPVIRRLAWIALAAHGGCYWFFGLYRGLWRFASTPDVLRIIKAVALGALVTIFLGTMVFHLQLVPRTVLVLYPVFLGLGMVCSRFCYRLLKDRRFALRRQEGKRTLIVGAGRAAELLLRDLLTRQEYQPVALVDDDPRKQGYEIHGVRVAGRLSEVRELVESLAIELVLFAIPSADKNVLPALMRDCAAIGVESRTLPSIHELENDRVEAAQLRPVTIEDLLGRDPVALDEEAIGRYLRGKTIMVTGGGGSIGSELCRQIAAAAPGRLIVYEHSEFNLYTIEQELMRDFPDLDLVVVLGDVKIANRVAWTMSKFRPDAVFHAAAYKHVPMVEKNPAEGVFNNVIGTRVVADAADRYGVERFVLVSTDKAVNPANVMGATKRIAELYCQNLAQRSKTKFITTRFGNVLGSAGSVVPLFERQIRDGGPVTVTHKEITRYFMTIPEAVGLILQAGAMGSGGEIYVLEMGEPVLIRELAEQMIRLSGLVPHEDIKIVYTGLRPGEKLYEEVFHSGEGLLGTDHPKLQLARSREVDWQWLTGELEHLAEAARSRDVGSLISHLQQIVPEFTGGARAAEPGGEEEGRLRLVAG